MGHHINARGEFQSDKHEWLPPDTILINPCRPQSAQAMLRWSDVGVWDIQLPRDDDPKPKVKMVIYFADPLNTLMLLAVAEAYKDQDGELSEDILVRLAALHPEGVQEKSPCAQIHEALGLLNSMVEGGEEHSDQSRKTLLDARSALKKLASAPAG